MFNIALSIKKLNMKLNRNISPDISTIKTIKTNNVEHFTLDNGIPVYLIKGGTQNIIKVDALLPAGAIKSNNKLNAPLTGLMLNEGTSAKNAQQLAETFDFYGAYFQPTIEKDIATIGLFSLTKHLNSTLTDFKDAIFNSTFPQEEFKNLVERRRQNFLIESEKTSFLAKEAFFSLLFGSEHPYGKPNKESYYDTVTRDEVFQFYKNNYIANELNLLISGKISDNELKLINETFGSLPFNKTNDSISNQVEFCTSNNFEFIEKPDAVQSSIRMGLLTVNKTNKDYIGLKILTTILGGYFGSRLMKNIREEKGYTYGIHAMQVSLLNGGYMAIAADVKAQFTNEAISEIKQEISKLCNQEVSIEEIDLVKNYMMGELLQFFDGPFNTAEAFKGNLIYNLGMDYYTNMIDQIQNINSSRLKQLAIKYFDLDKLVTVVAGKM